MFKKFVKKNIKVQKLSVHKITKKKVTQKKFLAFFSSKPRSVQSSQNFSCMKFKLIVI